jgi:hypothetical protein
LCAPKRWRCPTGLVLDSAWSLYSFGAKPRNAELLGAVRQSEKRPTGPGRNPSGRALFQWAFYDRHAMTTASRRWLFGYSRGWWQLANGLQERRRESLASIR